MHCCHHHYNHCCSSGYHDSCDDGPCDSSTHHGHGSHEEDLCEPKRFLLPREMVIDPAVPEKEFFIGGSASAKLTLEYMKITGALSPSVSLTITGPSAVDSTWSDAVVSESYSVKSDFPEAETGSRIKLKVTETIARLRWFEVTE